MIEKNFSEQIVLPQVLSKKRTIKKIRGQKRLSGERKMKIFPGKRKGDVLPRGQKKTNVGPLVPPALPFSPWAGGKGGEKDPSGMEKGVKTPVSSRKIQTGPVQRTGAEQIHHNSGGSRRKEGQVGPVLCPFPQGEGAGWALTEFFYCSSLAFTR